MPASTPVLEVLEPAWAPGQLWMSVGLSQAVSAWFSWPVPGNSFALVILELVWQHGHICSVRAEAPHKGCRQATAGSCTLWQQ